MKLALFLCLISVSLFAQKKKEDLDKKSTGLLDSTFNFKKYNTDCNCPLQKPGDRFPDSHPNAKYLNDTTLWEWKEVDVWGNGKLEKIYDLKPQYKDTLKRNDGSYIEVPVWLKNPNWKKPKAIDSTLLKKTLLNL